jgi:hypothetical protein
VAAVVALALSPTVASGAAIAHGRAVSVPLSITFDEGTAREGSVLTTSHNSGSAAVRIDVVTRSGGAARRTAGMASPWAVRLPAYTGSSDPARAVLRISATGTSDLLSPRTSAFSFGADFKLDATSTGSSVDNGDNLVQRGLYGDAAQYKIEVDGGRVACRIKGAAGTVYVRSSLSVRRGTWYRAICTRSSGAVVVYVASVSSAGPGSYVRTGRSGTTGDVNLPDAVPMSLGGKLGANGSMVLGATDQFNGVIDRVFYRLD